MFNKCPGQDSRKASAEIITCPGCGYAVEIFSDEIKVSCPNCKNLICQERLPACVDWCRSARECVGEQRYKQLKEGMSA